MVVAAADADGLRADVIRNDDFLGMRLVVDYLVASGHRAIAHLGGIGGGTAQERLAGYRAAMEHHGLRSEIVVADADFTEDAGYRGAAQLLRRDRPISAITAANDLAAVGALSAAADSGARVPTERGVRAGTDAPAVARMTGPRDQGRLRARLADGEPTLGTFLGTASPVVAEVCAAAGVDWLVLDLEHGAGGEEQVRTVVPVAASYGVPTVVRVESDERIRIGRVLDNGAAGVMLPRLDTAEQVREAIRHLYYPGTAAHGDRGVATYNRACRFGLDPGALDCANDQVVGIVQIESARAVAEVEEIASIDGVDVLFVGARDLSHDLGVPGQVEAREFLDAIEQVRLAAHKHGKAWIAEACAKSHKEHRPVRIEEVRIP